MYRSRVRTPKFQDPERVIFDFGTGCVGLGPARTNWGHTLALQFDALPTISELEARYIAHVLGVHGGNRSETARTLGIGRNTLLRKIKSYAIE